MKLSLPSTAKLGKFSWLAISLRCWTTMWPFPSATSLNTNKDMDTDLDDNVLGEESAHWRNFQRRDTAASLRYLQEASTCFPNQEEAKASLVPSWVLTSGGEEDTYGWGSTLLSSILVWPLLWNLVDNSKYMKKKQETFFEVINFGFVMEVVVWSVSDHC